MTQLFSPISLGKLALQNRIVISPMCQYSAEQGNASDWHEIHLGHLALSGAALLFIEATAVSPEGRISPADLGLWSEDNQVALARVLKAIRRYSAMPIAIQLAHAGRKASTRIPWEGGEAMSPAQGGWQTVAPSAFPYAAQDPLPTALDEPGLERVRNDFVRSALRARALGIELIEMHAAHGYLLHEFLSPLANLRTDQYGGTLDNRMRFPLQVFAALREAVPDLPLGVRISATDWVAGGWDLAQSVVFAKALQQLGCDFIDVSSGGLSPLQDIALGPGYQVPFAQTIRRETGLTTLAVGLITTPDQAEQIIASGAADMVSLARAMLYDPRWPWHAAAQLGAQVAAPPQYGRAPPREVKNLFRG